MFCLSLVTFRIHRGISKYLVGFEKSLEMTTDGCQQVSCFTHSELYIENRVDRKCSPIDKQQSEIKDAHDRPIVCLNANTVDTDIDISERYCGAIPLRDKLENFQSCVME